MAILGGALFGFAVTAASTTIWQTSSENGYTVGGLAAGAGLGLMVAALVRE
jgi:hypothetical protein